MKKESIFEKILKQNDLETSTETSLEKEKQFVADTLNELVWTFELRLAAVDERRKELTPETEKRIRKKHIEPIIAAIGIVEAYADSLKQDGEKANKELHKVIEEITEKTGG